MSRDATTGRYLPVDVAGRLWAKVVEEDRGYTSPCWIWTGGRGSGYGSLWVDGRTQLAHRVAYELLVGPIPVGLELDHLCRQTLCVQPLHLEPVTTRVNALRSTSPMAANARLTECRRGHPFTGTCRGRRTCRACAALRQRQHRARRAA